MSQRPHQSSEDRIVEAPQKKAQPNPHRRNSTPANPARDPLVVLERARRIAFEEQENERWDGLG